jgi:hypothetical protein
MKIIIDKMAPVVTRHGILTTVVSPVSVSDLKKTRKKANKNGIS